MPLHFKTLLGSWVWLLFVLLWVGLTSPDSSTNPASLLVKKCQDNNLCPFKVVDYQRWPLRVFLPISPVLEQEPELELMLQARPWDAEQWDGELCPENHAFDRWIYSNLSLALCEPNHPYQICLYGTVTSGW